MSRTPAKRARRKSTALVHRLSGIVAFLLVLSFLGSTVVVELHGDPDAILAVKRSIALGLLVLVPAMVGVGATGFRLGGGSRAPLVRRKAGRMRIIAANGILVLVPSALVLWSLAGRGAWGPAFVAVQGVEILAGTVNLVLLGRNIVDGLRLSGRLPRPGAPRRREGSPAPTTSSPPLERTLQS